MAEVAHIHEHERWSQSGPVTTTIEDEQLSIMAQRSMATVGAPEPMGLWAFATGTWIVGLVLAGAMPASTAPATIPVLLVFAGIAQFIAGLFAYRRASILASTAFCSFGSFNVATAVFFAMQAGGVLPTTGNALVIQGCLLESFALIAFTLSLGAMQKNWATTAFLVALGIGYALTGISYLTGTIGAGAPGVIGSIGGWFLVASAFFAWYTGAAIIANSMWERTILPLGGSA